jgi:hypothetical protein
VFVCTMEIGEEEQVSLWNDSASTEKEADESKYLI